MRKLRHTSRLATASTPVSKFSHAHIKVSQALAQKSSSLSYPLDQRSPTPQLSFLRLVESP